MGLSLDWLDSMPYTSPVSYRLFHNSRKHLCTIPRAERRKTCTNRLEHVDEELVDAAVTRHLRMKRRRQHAALPHGDDVTGGPAQHLHIGADAFDPRRADEHPTHAVVEPLERTVAIAR